jgi:hypothetical protein
MKPLVKAAQLLEEVNDDAAFAVSQALRFMELARVGSQASKPVLAQEATQFLSEAVTYLRMEYGLLGRDAQPVRPCEICGAAWGKNHTKGCPRRKS